MQETEQAAGRHLDFFEAYRGATHHEGRMQVCRDMCSNIPAYLKGVNQHVDQHLLDALQVAASLFSVDNSCAKQCALLIYRSILTILFADYDSEEEQEESGVSTMENNILQATTLAELSRFACSLVALLPCTDALLKAIQSKPVSVRQEIMKGAARVIERRRNHEHLKANARKLLSALYSGTTNKVPPLFWLHLCSWSEINTILNRVCDAYKLCGAKNPLLPGGPFHSIRWRSMWQRHGEALSKVFSELPDDIQIEGRHFPEDCPQVTDTLIAIVTADASNTDFSVLAGRIASLSTFLRARPVIRRLLILRPSVQEWLACLCNKDKVSVTPLELVTNNINDQLWKVAPRLCGAKKVATDKEIMRACMQMHTDMCEAMLQLRAQVNVEAPPKWFDRGRFIRHCGRFDQACLTAMHGLTVKHWGRHWFMDNYLTAIHTSFSAKRAMVPNKTAACPPIHWGNIAMFARDEDLAVSTFRAFLDDLQGVVPDAKVRGIWQHVTDVLPFKGLMIWLDDAGLALPEVEEEKAVDTSRSLWGWLFNY